MSLSSTPPEFASAYAGEARCAGARQPTTLLIVENAPVPRDRRVWQEAVTLKSAGWDVFVIAPTFSRESQPLVEVVDGINVFRFRLVEGSGSAMAWIREYLQALRRIRRLVRDLGRFTRFDVVHVANPPDLLLLAVLSERRRGSATIFDQHDLVPEMGYERFGSRARPLVTLLRLAERLSHHLADVAVVANDSFRDLAIARGGRSQDTTFVVRNGPKLERFVPLPPDESLRRGHAHLIVYEGVIGALDGVDHAVRALAALKDRDDWHALFLGDGDALPSVRRLAAQLGLEGRIDFAGFVGDEALRRAISSATVCIAPDPRSPLTDASTLIKVAEYMALGRPIAAYALRETVVTAGDCAAYAADNNPLDLARVIDELLRDPERRREMGANARRRVEELFAWEHSERSLLAAYDRALERASERGSGKGRTSRSGPPSNPARPSAPRRP